MPLAASDNTEQNIKKGMEDILWCVDAVGEHFKGEEMSNLLENLSPTMLQFCLLDGRFGIFKNVSETARRCENGDESLAAVYERVLEEAESQPVDPHVHPAFVKYKEKVAKLTRPHTADEEEDVAITASEVNTIDPFTMKQMVDPVRNKLCGHVYDMTSITEIMHKKRSIKCPVVGCTVSSFTKKDLEPDSEMRRILQRQSQGHSSRA
ncbi:E3 SUMO-protein ligase NSE2 [Anabrus simplex]|uniref:E3 SUMO-protein ligase NSE2 n=1 Tax=Anabrus simplex TaxID=316456 RepID=UPI0034DCCA6A